MTRRRVHRRGGGPSPAGGLPPPGGITGGAADGPPKDLGGGVTGGGAGGVAPEPAGPVGVVPEGAAPPGVVPGGWPCVSLVESLKSSWTAVGRGERRVYMMAQPWISVVVPALDEEKALPDVLVRLRDQRDAPPFEVILADGGSTDRTVPLFSEFTSSWRPPCRGAQVVACPRRGRAAQMNAGAGAARGEGLLFLHADTLLPPSALAAVASALSDPRVVGGGFRHRFREPGLLLAVISIWATFRSRALRVHYGDQAMFARRSTFEALGGFQDIPLFEDLRLAQSLRRAGRVVTVPDHVTTSARRLAQGGVLRTGLQFAALRARHALGADPVTLHRGYPDVR